MNDSSTSLWLIWYYSLSYFPYYIISPSFSYIRQASDSIEHLPLKQRDAVENACREIEWLLEDEIASALRRQAPITEENLNRVAEHIRCSYSQNKNCVFQKKHFNFVTGRTVFRWLAGVLFWPGERRILPAQDKKKSLIRRPRFFIRRPNGIFTAIITPIE